MLNKQATSSSMGISGNTKAQVQNANTINNTNQQDNAASPVSPTKSKGKQPSLAKKNKPTSLPPGVEGHNFGSLFIEMGQMEWFQYDGINYLHESGAVGQPSDFKPIQNLYANIRFWGESSKGIYLKCLNGMKKSEKVTNKFRYDICSPERTFEKYLDDMGVLIVDFFDTEKNQTVGTSKIMMKLYIKRAKRDEDDSPLLELRGSFPITLTGNQNIKIGQFQITLMSSFPLPGAPSRGINAGVAEEEGQALNMNQDLNDSFIQNEKKAQQIANQPRNNLLDNIFQDNRIPSSLQGKRPNNDYKSQEFLNHGSAQPQRTVDFEIDERPTRDRSGVVSRKPQGHNFGGKENQARNTINIDENEDTYHNQEALTQAILKGQQLSQKITQSLEPSLAWETLHGPFHVAKKYVPPFQTGTQNDEYKADEIDRFYELELEGPDPKEAERVAKQTQQKAEEDLIISSAQGQTTGGHINEMRFIKVKIQNVKIENEKLLHDILDSSFNLIVEVPLPDIYQKKVTYQSLKLNNYDIAGFNEFVYNSSSLYNFKLDEETFNKLVNSNLKISLEGLSVTASMPIIKLVMAKDYKLEITLPLEKLIKIEDATYSQPASNANQGTKKADPKKSGKGGKEQQKKGGKDNKDIAQVKPSIVGQLQPHSQKVGCITIELQLQRGETEVEVAREYQIKLKKLEEQKAQEDQQRAAEYQRYSKYHHAQEPVFAQLYINIHQVKNLCLNRDGSIITQQAQIVTQPPKFTEETFNERIGVNQEDDASQNQQDNSQTPKRNLYVQYKAFPGLEKLKTSVVWHEREPKFNYRSQFPIIINSATIDKLQNFTFILEVWDSVQPSQEEFIGLVKIPLASFCYSMRTNDEQIFSLNFLADQHCLYPMTISDGFLPIYSPRLGQNVGELSITLALGSTVQVNRQIQKEQEVEKQHIELEMKKKIAEAMKKAQSNVISELPILQSNFQSLPQPSQANDQLLLQVPANQNQHSSADSPKGLARNLFGDMLGGTPAPGGEGLQGNELFKSIGNFLRQSVNVNGSVSRDVDYRKLTYLNCLRKLFEEARQSDIKELNGQSEIFREMPKNYDGTIKKDDFNYAILNTKSFTLTRTEISNIAALITTQGNGIMQKSTDNNSIDLEDLQRSYRSYLTYYDSIEPKIQDLLEKFMLSIQKKITDPSDQDAFVQSIEDKASESKISLTDLRDIFDNNGIDIRDSLYSQLASYFDLDRNDQIYITSFCEYLKNPRMQSFNFFKVHPIIVVNLVAEYVKDQVLFNADTLEMLEEEFKQELKPKHAQSVRIEGEDTLQQEQMQVPDDLLVNERISSRVFQILLRKHGIQLSQWEVFILFDYLNTTYQKMFYEPQRYHQIPFPAFYRFITNQDYESKIKENARKREALAREDQMRREYEQHQQDLIDQHQQRMAEQNPLLKASLESAFELAADLNRKKKDGAGSDGIYSSKSYDKISEKQNESEDVVIKKKGKKSKGKKKRSSSRVESAKRRKEMTFAEDKAKHSESEDYDEEEESEDENVSSLSKKPFVEDNRPYRKVKHIFEIQVKELKNIAILDKLIKDIQSLDNSKSQRSKQLKHNAKESNKNKYIQCAAVKYSFPLDEDEMFQSDFIQLNTDQLHESSQYDYKVSINTVHNYVMSKDEPIQKLLQNANNHLDASSLFNISVVVNDNNKEFVIGNAQMPIEDLIDIVETYNAKIQNGQLPAEKQVLSRILFINGTSYSQRENIIIGKMQVEIKYSIEKQFLTSAEQQALDQPLLQEGDQFEGNNSCFLHRETFIKRKIPLNAVLSIEIDRINNLKESLENIEHFAKIQASAQNDKGAAASSHRVSAFGGSHLGSKNASSSVMQTREQNDRRRILTQIFKHGLNLVVLASIFEEDNELKKRLPNSTHTSRLLFKTLNPIFGEGFELGIQMDTQIFDYLKNKRAVFEIRHYIIDSEKKQANAGGVSMSNHKSESSVSQMSQNTEENEERDLMNECEYIVIGFVRVPLLHLITKNNGIDGDFVIFDDYKQQMGSLKLRISLNHHSNKRPLYSETNKLPSTQFVNPDNQSDSRCTMIDKTLKLSQSLVRSTKTGIQEFSRQQQYLLGLNFVELLFKNRNQQQLFGNEDQSFMYLKFRLLGQTYQTKFISSVNSCQNSVFLRQLNLTVFDIRKTVFIELDFLKQREIEEAFARPLEVQLWLKKSHASRYHQPEEEVQLGSFFLELNDIGKLRNRRVKDQNGLLQSYEGYFTLYDYQRQLVTADRLGCKILLIKKEYDSQLSDLEVLFHNLNGLESIVQNNLDPACKGFADLEDIQQEVAKALQDPYQSLMRSYIETLEYKNSDKVYYSALLGPVAPFFRYAKRFDSFGVIEKFGKELQSIDTHGTGLVPVNLFRSVLEHELKIKEKIVLDFISNLRETDSSGQLQSIDVNLFSHSLRSHIDYVVLLRKLAQYYELRSENKKDERAMTSTLQQHASGGEEVMLKFNIESAIRLKNPTSDFEPPNAYVVLNLARLGCSPQSFQTHVVHRSSYPAWHLANQQAKFSLNSESLRWIIEYPLEFEVYHQQAGYRDSISNIPIGVAYVDLSQMVFVDGTFTISGYFHVVKKCGSFDGQTVPLMDPHRLSMESLGQLKLSIQSSTDLKRAVNANQATRLIAKENSPISNLRVTEVQLYNLANPFSSQEFRRSPLKSNYGSQIPYPQSITQQKLEQSFNDAGLELQDKHEDELKSTLLTKMSELDQLTKGMRERVQSRSPPRDLRIDQPMNFGLTMGHGQSADLRSSFQPFAFQHPSRGGGHLYQTTGSAAIREDLPEAEMSSIQQEYQEMQRRQAAAIAQQREYDEKEDSFRRENVFENNRSQSSSNFKLDEDGVDDITLQAQTLAALNNELTAPPLTGTFNYNTFNQHQRLTEEAALGLGGVIGNTIDGSNTNNIFTDNVYRLSKTENDDNQEEEDINAKRQIARQQQQMQEEEEDDEAKMERIARILKSTGLTAKQQQQQ